MCVLYLFFCLHALNKLVNSYFICFEYVWIFLLLYIYIVCVCACVLSEDSISPSWARAGCKKTLSLIHYPCEIKFSQSVSQSLPDQLYHASHVTASWLSSLSKRLHVQHGCCIQQVLPVTRKKYLSRSEIWYKVFLNGFYIVSFYFVVF